MEFINQKFVEICRTVLKEKHPELVETCNDNVFPSDVLRESLKRYFAGKKLVIRPRIQLPVGTHSKPKIERIMYV